MKKYITFDEIECLCEGIVISFMKKMDYKDIRSVDIRTLVTKYLGLPLEHEHFAEDDKRKIGFFSDGVKPLRVQRNGHVEEVVFPAGTVVVEKMLTAPAESGRYRFTLAHEAGHKIITDHLPVQLQAAFHSDFDTTLPYTPELLREAFEINETFANRAAACLLMPRFLVEKAFKKYNGGKPIAAYGDAAVITKEDKITIRKIADEMGVSYLSLYYRLKELKLFEYHPIEEIADRYYREREETHEQGK